MTPLIDITNNLYRCCIPIADCNFMDLFRCNIFQVVKNSFNIASYRYAVIICAFDFSISLFLGACTGIVFMQLWAVHFIQTDKLSAITEVRHHFLKCFDRTSSYIPDSEPVNCKSPFLPEKVCDAEIECKHTHKCRAREPF